MKKYPKFIATPHPFDDNMFLIIHTQAPSFIAVAIPTNFNEIESLKQNIHVSVKSVKASIGTQTFFDDQLWGIFVIKFFNEDKVDIDFNAVDQFGIMSRTGDWFYSFLKNQK